MLRYLELLIVISAMLVPQFLLASEVDGDEYAKSTIGVALAAAILGAYKAWKHVVEVRGANGNP